MDSKNPNDFFEQIFGVPAEVVRPPVGLDDGSTFNPQRGYEVCGSGHKVDPVNIGHCVKCGRAHCTVSGCMLSLGECRSCYGKVKFQSGGINEPGKLLSEKPNP